MPTDKPSDKSLVAIEKFNKKQHDRKSFSCGDAQLDNLLTISASNLIKHGVVAAYVAVEKNNPAVLGYYMLSASTVSTDLITKAISNSVVRYVPVVYVRAVAVHANQQNGGIGTRLMIHAMQQCLEVSERIGVTAIVLDVGEEEGYERRLKFYQNLGFISLNDQKNPHRFFVSMANVRKTLEQNR